MGFSMDDRCVALSLRLEHMVFLFFEPSLNCDRGGL
jgi:hypothetical protein